MIPAPHINWEWWCAPVIPELRRWRPDNPEFMAKLSYIRVPEQPGLHRETLFWGDTHRLRKPSALTREGLLEWAVLGGGGNSAGPRGENRWLLNARSHPARCVTIPRPREHLERGKGGAEWG